MDEEFIDLHPTEGEPRLLATQWVDPVDRPLERRLAVSPDGQYLVVGSGGDGAFHLHGPGKESFRVAANEGGRVLFGPSSRYFLLALDGVGYTRLVVVDAWTGAHEDWAEVLGARSVAFGASGILVAHALPGGGGAVTLVTGRDRQVVLARGAAPTALAVRGNRIAFFDGTQARAADLSNGTEEALGEAPEEIAHAAWSSAGLHAAGATGLYRMTDERRWTRLVSDPSIHTLFAVNGGVAWASSERAYFASERPRLLLREGRKNLAQLTEDPRGDFLIVRGRSVHRLAGSGHLGPAIGKGRPGMRLRGAVAFAGGVVTWSSQRWTRSEGSLCSRSPTETRFLAE
jgi:hypothetical protein